MLNWRSCVRGDTYGDIGGPPAEHRRSIGGAKTSNYEGQERVELAKYIEPSRPPLSPEDIGIYMADPGHLFQTQLNSLLIVESPFSHSLRKYQPQILFFLGCAR